MKHALVALVAAIAMIGSTGCLGLHGKCGCGNGACSAGNGGSHFGGCAKCGHGLGKHGGCAKCGHGLRKHGDPNDGYGGNPQMVNNGPASAAVSYPYYTTRGPRDFLINNPPSIGR
jgi:hypothetical protein